jgi:hypothetical protein
MDVQVDDQHAVCAPTLLQRTRSYGQVVENAVAGAKAVVGMVRTAGCAACQAVLQRQFGCQ